MFELLAALVARSLVVAGEQGPQTRYRLLETIRQYGEERLSEAGEAERRRAGHADYYAELITRVREDAHDPRAEVFWAVRLSAEQDNLLAAWSWAIGTGNVGTAFRILAGFAPSEVRSSYPLLLDGEAALGLPGAGTRHERAWRAICDDTHRRQWFLAGQRLGLGQFMRVVGQMGEPTEFWNNDTANRPAGGLRHAGGRGLLAATDALAVVLHDDISARPAGDIGVAFTWLAEQHLPGRKAVRGQDSCVARNIRRVGV